MNRLRRACLILATVVLLSAACGVLAMDARAPIAARTEGDVPEIIVTPPVEILTPTPEQPTPEPATPTPPAPTPPTPTPPTPTPPTPTPPTPTPPTPTPPTPTPPTPTPPTPTPTATPTPTPTATPTPTPTPSPTPLIPYKVIITAQDARIAWMGTASDPEGGVPTIDENQQNISEADIRAMLLTYASAVDELGQPVSVAVDEDSGFSPYKLGSFEIRYRAVHPISQEVFTVSCFITVEDQGTGEEELPPEEEEKPLVLDKSSNDRYRKYLSYRDSIQEKLAVLIDGLNAQFSERVQMILSAFPDVTNVQFARRVTVEQDAFDETAITELIPLDSPEIHNWSQVLPVYVANSSMKVNQPLDLYNLRSMPLDDIESVFWDMHEWNYERDGDTLTLILRELTNEEMIERYKMDPVTVNKLDELMQPEFQMLFAALTKDDTFTDLAEGDVEAIRASLPEGLNMQRETVVLTAHTLVGQIKYFWGGKYNQVGWNPMWGVDKLVESPNSETYGTVRAYGMDCSGFVSWVFVNAAKDPSVADAIGTGTSIQWGKSRPLGWDEAEPGDIAFFNTPGQKNHVGIVVEKREDGTYLVAHCSSSKNAVVITEAWSTGFRYMRRPVLYEGA